MKFDVSIVQACGITAWQHRQARLSSVRRPVGVSAEAWREITDSDLDAAHGFMHGSVKEMMTRYPAQFPNMQCAALALVRAELGWARRKTQ